MQRYWIVVLFALFAGLTTLSGCGETAPTANAKNTEVKANTVADEDNPLSTALEDETLMDEAVSKKDKEDLEKLLDEPADSKEAMGLDNDDDKNPILDADDNNTAAAEDDKDEDLELD